MVSGGVHLWIAPEHFSHTPAHGLFFAGIGAAQVLWSLAWLIWRRHNSPLMTVLGAALSGGLMVVWVLAHGVATPFSAETHPSDTAAYVTKGAELIACIALVVLSLLWRPQHISLMRRAGLLGGGLSMGVVMWFGGVVTAPLFPALAGEAHTHDVVSLPLPMRRSTSAYFNIVNTGTQDDVLIGVSGDSADIITLHRTAVDERDVARMEGLGGITLKPHVTVRFAPTGHHVMLEGLYRELYEGDKISLTLRFTSGKTVDVELDVLMFPPESRVNFVSVEGFQISNAWVRATTSSDGMMVVDADSYVWKLPVGFPLPRVPENNPMTEEKVELGRYLFYDTRLSGNGTMSCSSCHLQALAFSDGVARPLGSTGDMHPRNSMTLTNSAYSATLTWANPNLLTLERQIPIPMFGEHPVEMGITGNEARVLDRLRQDELYRQMFAAAFPNDADPFTFNNVTLSLSSFVRTLISGNSSYDLYLRGDQDALSESAKRGMALFFSESLECHHCHTGFNMTLSSVTANSTFDERPFFNTGLYNIGGTGAYPPDNTGIHEITNNPADMGRFRPPTLRNIALTAPYMHDGSIATLTEVIRFYEDGGRLITEGEYAGDGRVNPYKNGFVSGFSLNDDEIADLVAFLESLTDEQFITDPRFSDPFAAPDP
jgi:cytochrome c peroxidase